MIVVDTSVLVDLFRGLDNPAVRRLVELEQAGGGFMIPTICCQELLQGARDEGEWRLLLEYLSTQQHLVANDPWTTHVGAARLYFECRRRGVTIRSTVDCLIAQLTMDAGGTLLHSDQNFERIASVAPLSVWSA